jgi:hypothetical protein
MSLLVDTSEWLLALRRDAPVCTALVVLFWAFIWATGCSCRLHHGLQQVAQADQVVGDPMQAKHGTDFVLAAQFELTQSAVCLDPTKYLFDSTAGMDRLGVAHVAGGATIDR